MTVFSQKITDVICERMACGESLRGICEDPTMPGTSTVMRWLQKHSDFRDQYARAREAQADFYADDIVHLSDQDSVSRRTFVNDDGSVETLTVDMVARTRVQIDARKWFASKIAPKKYGDRTQIEHGGGMTVNSVTDQSDEQLAAIVAGICHSGFADGRG